MNFDGRLASASITDSLRAHHARQYQVPAKLAHGQDDYWQACVARIARQLSNTVYLHSTYMPCVVTQRCEHGNSIWLRKGANTVTQYGKQVSLLRQFTGVGSSDASRFANTRVASSWCSTCIPHNEDHHHHHQRGDQRLSAIDGCGRPWPHRGDIVKGVQVRELARSASSRHTQSYGHRFTQWRAVAETNLES